MPFKSKAPKNDNKIHKTVALAGNPNVGKSTIFNALTGLRQHTGNWIGKTVSLSKGRGESENFIYDIYDLPGTYSLLSHSVEEEIARNFICFGSADGVVVVCDATALSRNLGLLLQISEMSDRVLLCINLADEAERRGISINLSRLEEELGIKAVLLSARRKGETDKIKKGMDALFLSPQRRKNILSYPEGLEECISKLAEELADAQSFGINPRWLSLRLLSDDKEIIKEAQKLLPSGYLKCELLEKASKYAKNLQEQFGSHLSELIASHIAMRGEQIASKCIERHKPKRGDKIKIIDKIMVGKLTAYPLMLLLFLGIFWLSVTAANYPSECLRSFFKWIGEGLSEAIGYLGLPKIFEDILVNGIFGVLSWVVAVMLPPMAIFFPLFTLLEDFGYLPRIAYALDKPFSKCGACGKQALCMCMGLGCNTVGITGCRIIDSKRERLLAILTNSLMPCNGRFPAIILLINLAILFSFGSSSPMLSAVGLGAVILLSVSATFMLTLFLSKTLLRGTPSAFTLELPPLRPVQIWKVAVRSVFDRTLFVLGRAAAVAAPAGLLIWIMANVRIGDNSLMLILAEVLEPFAEIFGLDGILLLAFMLSFPANEITLPIALMAYMGAGSPLEYEGLSGLPELLLNNGWDLKRVLCVLVFTLFHWPCSTSLITVKKETGSLKWTLLSATLPTALGLILCFLINLIFSAID